MSLPEAQEDSTQDDVQVVAMPLPAIHSATIPHEQQRYPTVGDWFIDEHGARQYRVSDMGNADYEFMVLIHEMIEHHLCDRAGVTQEQVDEFDMQFEKDRAAGRHSQTEEPGDDPTAPYFAAHQKATHIERQICQHMGIDWDTYIKATGELP